MAREDFRKQLTDRLVAFMEEEGGMPWQKGWNAVNVRPFNPGTGVKYRGGNVLNLLHAALARNSDDSRWMTLKQANAAGYSIRKGAVGEKVEYWDWGQAKAKRERELDDQGNEIEQKADAELDDEPARPRKPLVFYAVVFNGADIVGLHEMKRDVSWKPNELAEKLIAATGAVVEHRAVSKTAGGRTMTNAAYYDNAGDQIILPPLTSFKSKDDYYATKMHELAHWTGHKSRLNRLEGTAFGSPEYAKEELRAEIAAMFLTSMFGLEGKVQNHAAYASNWIEVLKKDKHELFRAAKDAEAIVDHLLEYAPELKAILDQRVADNMIKEPAKRRADAAISALPNFVPAGVKVEVAALTEEARWQRFEKAVRGEAIKYGVSDDTVERTLVLIKPQFNDLMNAAEANNYTVEDMNDMLLKQLVQEMRLNREREQHWNKYCEQVREAAVGVLSAEGVEIELQALGARYFKLLEKAGQEDWSKDDTDKAIRDIIYGDAGRRQITADYVRERFPSKDAPAVSADDDDDFALTPTGGGMVLDDADDDFTLAPIGDAMNVSDAFPADAAPTADEPLSKHPKIEELDMSGP
ncbi:antirestriction protein ArdC [Massilia sp. MP_M2]|uniref:ArdC family protein n=1 Tax=Massilia sp. MP_M2 TaxID=3071713 RepID=UPI00319DE649